MDKWRMTRDYNSALQSSRRCGAKRASAPPGVSAAVGKSDSRKVGQMTNDYNPAVRLQSSAIVQRSRKVGSLPEGQRTKRVLQKIFFPACATKFFYPRFLFYASPHTPLLPRF